MDDFAVYEAFSPLDYLHSYYGELLTEADGLLKFLVESFADLPSGCSVLEFGGGPTLIGLIPAARRASRIHFCDYVPENRAMVERWLAGDGSEFDWSPFVVRALEHEGVASPTKADVAKRCAQIRSVVRKVTSCDIYASPPVEVEGLFDVVVSNYCLDAVTNDKAQWHENIRNVKGLLRPGGLFVIASLLDATYSDFGHTRYPNVRLQETDVREALEATGFEPASIRLVSAPADHAGREYRGVVLAAATH